MDWNLLYAMPTGEVVVNVPILYIFIIYLLSDVFSLFFFFFYITVV